MTIISDIDLDSTGINLVS